MGRPGSEGARYVTGHTLVGGAVGGAVLKN